MKTSFTLLALTMVLGAWPAYSNAQTATPARVEVGFPNFYPYGFTNDIGQADGLDMRFAQALFTQLNIPYRSTIYPPARVLLNMQNGNTVFTILVNVPALDSCCLYSKKPVMRDELRVYYGAGMAPIKSKEDLVGKHIVTQHGFSYGGLATYFNDRNNRITNNITHSHESAFAMLKAGRADYVVVYGAAAKLLSPSVLRHLRYGTIADLNIYMVLNKTYPDAERAMARMELIATTIDTNTLFKPFTNGFGSRRKP